MLQNETLDLVDSRIMFDEVLACFAGEESFEKYLSPKEQLVYCPIFEDAVRKILSAELLNVEEKKAVRLLTLEPGPSQASSSIQDAQDFATRALQKRQRLGVQRQYITSMQIHFTDFKHDGEVL